MNSRSGQVLVVERPAVGVYLVDLLRQHVPTAHPVDVRAAVTSGSVRVNGEACLANRRLRFGDVVEVLQPIVPRPVARAEARDLPAVCFESASTLVIGKPAGLATIPDRSGQDRGVHGLLPRLRPDADLRIVHRLDRDTSGCLILAKGLEAARYFDAQFQHGCVRKTYLALVAGVPAKAEFAIDAWLGPDRARPGKVVASATERPGFRAAHTDVAVETTFARHALLRLMPTTGRSHQLRVHLQSIGHSIVGDRDYGGEELLLSQLKSGYKARQGVAERPLVPRMFLHAVRLQFRDLDGSEVVAEAPLPEDLELALRQLQTFDDRRR